MPPPPYMTHTFPGVPVHDVLFCPFDDVLGVGHAAGFTSLVIPGAGEANFDSLEADPYEGKRRRQEREVNALLDKIPFDLITLDTDLLGKLDKKVAAPEETKMGGKEVAFAKRTRMVRLKEGARAVEEEDESSGEEDEGEEEKSRRREQRVEKADAKKRARGRNSTLKKMLRKRRRDIVDPQTVSTPPVPPFSSLFAHFNSWCRSRSKRSWRGPATRPRRPSSTRSPPSPPRPGPQVLSTGSRSSSVLQPATSAVFMGQSALLAVCSLLPRPVGWACLGGSERWGFGMKELSSRHTLDIPTAPPQHCRRLLVSLFETCTLRYISTMYIYSQMGISPLSLRSLSGVGVIADSWSLVDEGGGGKTRIPESAEGCRGVREKEMKGAHPRMDPMTCTSRRVMAQPMKIPQAQGEEEERYLDAGGWASRCQ